MEVLKTLIVLFLLVNALFWGLFTHETHCKLALRFVDKCPPHYVHLLTGIVSFLLLVLYVHYDYIKTLKN